MLPRSPTRNDRPTPARRVVHHCVLQLFFRTKGTGARPVVVIVADFANVEFAVGRPAMNLPAHIMAKPIHEESLTPNRLAISSTRRSSGSNAAYATRTPIVEPYFVSRPRDFPG
jgi:hypothetical protein